MIRVLLLGALLGTFLGGLRAAEADEYTIAIVGTGSVARALGPTWAGAGHRIRYGTRNPDREEVAALRAASGPDAFAGPSVEAVRGARVVVLAVPGPAAVELAAELPLDGKIVIDCTNSLQFEDGIVKLSSPSTAQLVQARATGAAVVKTLNTINANFMKGEAPKGIVVPLAGDDEAAKALVTSLLTDLNLASRDVGPLYNARYVEAMGALYVYMNVFKDRELGFEYGFLAR